MDDNETNIDNLPYSLSLFSPPDNPSHDKYTDKTRDQRSTSNVDSDTDDEVKKPKAQKEDNESPYITDSNSKLCIDSNNIIKRNWNQRHSTQGR